MKNLAGVTLAKVWAEFVRAQNSKCVLAHIADLGFGFCGYLGQGIHF